MTCTALATILSRTTRIFRASPRTRRPASEPYYCSSSLCSAPFSSSPALPSSFSGDLGGGINSEHNSTKGNENKNKNRVRVGQSGMMVRTFESVDVKTFATLSGDFNPVHFDVVESSPFDRPIVHGMLYSTMFGTTFATLVPGVIYLQQSLKFINPVYVGDEVSSKIEVKKIKGNIAICDTTAERVSDGTQVITGEAKVLIPKHLLS